MHKLRLSRVAPALERGLYVRAGTVLGTDDGDGPIVLDHPLVVVAIGRDRGGWLVTYRTLGVSTSQASGAVNSRIRPVAS